MPCIYGASPGSTRHAYSANVEEKRLCPHSSALLLPVPDHPCPLPGRTESPSPSLLLLPEPKIPNPAPESPDEDTDVKLFSLFNGLVISGIVGVFARLLFAEFDGVIFCTRGPGPPAPDADKEAEPGFFFRRSTDALLPRRLLGGAGSASGVGVVEREEPRECEPERRLPLPLRRRFSVPPTLPCCLWT